MDESRETREVDDDVAIDVVLDDAGAQLADDVRRGLSASAKWLPPKWFYDERGSELFDQITRLEEYYQTEAERSILTAHADEIIAGVDTIIELGSGTSDKTRTLLAAGIAHQLSNFVAFDVSEQTLRDAIKILSDEYPTVRVDGVVGDFERHLELLPRGPRWGRRLVLFLGGTIGNLVPSERAALLRSLVENLEPGDEFLLGVDLVKDADRLIWAYDDRAGVTAEFDLNVLQVINRVLGADFPLEQFEHHAVWDADNEWIEMRLVAREALVVAIPGASLTVRFEAGESIRTEISAKFRRPGVERELAAAGLDLTQWWTDDDDDFAVALATRRAG
jgi:dimethylhistidine N-methyltransferase